MTASHEPQLAAINEPAPGARLALARLVARIAPPFVAPALTERICPSKLHVTGDSQHMFMKSITGSRAAWRFSDIHAHSFAIHGYYDWRLLAVASAVIDAPTTVIEVGANVGTETIPLADLVGDEGTVHAFEPLPANLDELRHAVDASQRHNIAVHAIALSDQRGSMSFSPPSDRRMTGTGHLTNSPAEGMITVDVSTLDDEFRDQRHIGFIAMDVEGAEIYVLRGGRTVLRANRPVIVLEACGSIAQRAGSSLAELHTELRDQGYTVQAIRRFGLKAVNLDHAGEPCNWVAVPNERPDLLRRIDQAIFRTGLMPPLPGLNPLATRRSFAKRR